MATNIKPLESFKELFFQKEYTVQLSSNNIRIGIKIC